MGAPGRHTSFGLWPCVVFLPPARPWHILSKCRTKLDNIFTLSSHARHAFINTLGCQLALFEGNDPGTYFRQMWQRAFRNNGMCGLDPERNEKIRLDPSFKTTRRYIKQQRYTPYRCFVLSFLLFLFCSLVLYMEITNRILIIYFCHMLNRWNSKTFLPDTRESILHAAFIT